MRNFSAKFGDDRGVEIEFSNGFGTKDVDLLYFLVPMWVTLFDAERINRSISRIHNPILFAGFHDGLVDRNEEIIRNVKLPTKFTNETHSQSQDLYRF